MASALRKYFFGSGEKKERKSEPKYYCSNDPFNPYCSTSASAPYSGTYDYPVKGLHTGFDDKDTCERECLSEMQRQFTLPNELQTLVRQFLPDDLGMELKEVKRAHTNFDLIPFNATDTLDESKRSYAHQPSHSVHPAHPVLAKMFPKVASEFLGDETTILNAMLSGDFEVVYQMLDARKGIGMVNEILNLAEKFIDFNNANANPNNLSDYNVFVRPIVNLILQKDYLYTRLSKDSVTILQSLLVSDIDRCLSNPFFCSDARRYVENLVRSNVVRSPTELLYWKIKSIDDRTLYNYVVKDALNLLLAKNYPITSKELGDFHDVFILRQAINNTCETEASGPWNQFANLYFSHPEIRERYKREYELLQTLNALFLQPITPEARGTIQQECQLLREKSTPLL